MEMAVMSTKKPASTIAPRMTHLRKQANIHSHPSEKHSSISPCRAAASAFVMHAIGRDLGFAWSRAARHRSGSSTAIGFDAQVWNVISRAVSDVK
jgi:hypothetical protein